jgi:hypothetical protein
VITAKQQQLYSWLVITRGHDAKHASKSSQVNKQLQSFQNNDEHACNRRYHAQQGSIQQPSCV